MLASQVTQLMAAWENWKKALKREQKFQRTILWDFSTPSHNLLVFSLSSRCVFWAKQVARASGDASLVEVKTAAGGGGGPGRPHKHGDTSGHHHNDLELRRLTPGEEQHIAY